MVLYTCARCGYSNKIKTKMKNHLMRKNSCRIVLKSLSVEECYQELFAEKMIKYPKNTLRYPKNIPKIRSGTPKRGKSTLSYVEQTQKTDICNNVEQCSQCPYCETQFKDNRYLKEHIKKYHLSQNTTDFYTKDEVDAKLKEKDDIITNLRDNISKLLEKVGTNTTYNTYNIVNIKPFGKENTSYVTDKYINSLIKAGPYDSIPKLLKYLHFHPKHTENHNVKIPNKKLPFAQIYNGQDWEYRDKRATIESLSNKAYTIINSHYNGCNDYMNTFKMKFNDNTKALLKRVNKDIELTIINSQKTIHMPK